MTPRKPLADLKRDEIPDAVDVAVYELNKLLKVAASEDLYVQVDVVDRGEAPEVKVDCR